LCLERQRLTGRGRDRVNGRTWIAGAANPVLRRSTPVYPEAQPVDRRLRVVIEDHSLELDDHARLVARDRPATADAPVLTTRRLGRVFIGRVPFGFDRTAVPLGRAPTPVAYRTASETPSRPRSFSIDVSDSAIEQNGARPSHVATRQ